jgi:hypothetical protein
MILGSSFLKPLDHEEEPLLMGLMGAPLLLPWYEETAKREFSRTQEAGFSQTLTLFMP